MPATNLRQRKASASNKKKKTKKDPTHSTTASSSNDAISTPGTNIDASESLLQVFLQHPLVRVAPFVLVPYFLYHAFFVVSLQHPELITTATLGLYKMRPSLKATDMRQVLILGPEVAENRYVTTGLSKTLRLEVVNEAFDAQQYHCRDGSASWFQLMRFLEPLEGSSDKAKVGVWKELCVDRNHSLVEIFHPNLYPPRSGSESCSRFEKWSSCWARQCLANVHATWGCAWKEEGCDISFAKVLHQVRHPLRTIEFLNASICPHEDLRESFLTIVSGWFPNRQWETFSCLQAMSYYTLDFHTTLQKARDVGLVHGIFQVETTSPCEVAAQAGFLEEHSVLYTPNFKTTNKVCQLEEEKAINDAQSTGTFSKIKETSGVKIPDMQTISLDDLGDKELAKALEQLISTLGYGSNGQDSEFL